jgi:hypothetical protein
MALSAKRPSRSQSAKAAALAAVADTGKKRRLNAEVDEALYKQIRRCALEEDSSISEITRRLWLEYLSK